MFWLDVLGNLSAIATAIVATVGYVHYRCDQRKKRIKLEAYLKARKLHEKTWQHSLLHLMAKLGMTENELVNASFTSKHINRLIAEDKETGRAAALLLEYAD